MILGHQPAIYALRRRLVAAVQNGHGTVAEIAAVEGLTTRKVREQLLRLRKQGLVALRWTYVGDDLEKPVR